MSQEKRCMLSAPDGANVVGVLTKPNGTTRGAFLLLHGISTNKDEYLNFLKTAAQRLAKEGFASLRIDFRGHGESSVSPSEFTIGSQILDGEAALNFLLKDEGFDRVNCLGCSFGAPPCIFLKALHPSKIGFVCLLAPVLDYRRTFIEPVSDWGRGLFTPDALARCLSDGDKIAMDGKFYVGPSLLASMLHSDVEVGIRQIPGSITIIHGDKDGMVPLSITQDVVARNSQLHLITMPQMEHGFTNYGDESGTSAATAANLDRILAILVKGAQQ